MGVPYWHTLFGPTYHRLSGGLWSRELIYVHLRPSAVELKRPPADDKANLVLGTGGGRGTLYASRITFHASRITFHASRITFHASPHPSPAPVLPASLTVRR